MAENKNQNKPVINNKTNDNASPVINPNMFNVANNNNKNNVSEIDKNNIPPMQETSKLGTNTVLPNSLYGITKLEQNSNVKINQEPFINNSKSKGVKLKDNLDNEVNGKNTIPDSFIINDVNQQLKAYGLSSVKGDAKTPSNKVANDLSSMIGNANIPKVKDTGVSFKTSTKDYTDYRKYLPDITSSMDVDELRAQRQTVGETWRRGFARFGGRLVTAFAEPFVDLTVGLTSAAVNKDFSKFYDNGVTNAMDSFNDYLTKKYPIYYTQREQEASALSGDNIWSDAFWADKVLNGAAFTIATIASSLALAGVGKAASMAGRAVKYAKPVRAIVGNASKAIGKVPNIGNVAKIAAAEGINAPVTTLANGKYFNMFKNYAASNIAAFSEAGIETRELKKTLKPKLQYLVDSGQIEQGEADARLTAAMNSTFFINTAIVGMSNHLQFGRNLLNPASFGKRSMANKVVMNDGKLALWKDVVDNKILKASANTVRMMKPLSSLGTEALEEGSQWFAQRWNEERYARAQSLGALEAAARTADIMRTDKEAHESMFIGAILGMFGAGSSIRSDTQQTKYDRQVIEELNQRLLGKDSALAQYLNHVVTTQQARNTKVNKFIPLNKKAIEETSSYFTNNAVAENQVTENELIMLSAFLGENDLLSVFNDNIDGILEAEESIYKENAELNEDADTVEYFENHNQVADALKKRVAKYATIYNDTMNKYSAYDKSYTSGLYQLRAKLSNLTNDYQELYDEVSNLIGETNTDTELSNFDYHYKKAAEEVKSELKENYKQYLENTKESDRTYSSFDSYLLGNNFKAKVMAKVNNSIINKIMPKLNATKKDNDTWIFEGEQADENKAMAEAVVHLNSIHSSLAYLDNTVAFMKTYDGYRQLSNAATSEAQTAGFEQEFDKYNNIIKDYSNKYSSIANEDVTSLQTLQQDINDYINKLTAEQSTKKVDYETTNDILAKRRKKGELDAISTTIAGLNQLATQIQTDINNGGKNKTNESDETKTKDTSSSETKGETKGETTKPKEPDTISDKEGNLTTKGKNHYRSLIKKLYDERNELADKLKLVYNRYFAEDQNNPYAIDINQLIEYLIGDNANSLGNRLDTLIKLVDQDVVSEEDINTYYQTYKKDIEEFATEKVDVIIKRVAEHFAKSDDTSKPSKTKTSKPTTTSESHKDFTSRKNIIIDNMTTEKQRLVDEGKTEKEAIDETLQTAFSILVTNLGEDSDILTTEIISDETTQPFTYNINPNDLMATAIALMDKNNPAGIYQAMVERIGKKAANDYFNNKLYVLEFIQTEFAEQSKDNLFDLLDNERLYDILDKAYELYMATITETYKTLNNYSATRADFVKLINEGFVDYILSDENLKEARNEILGEENNTTYTDAHNSLATRNTTAYTLKNGNEVYTNTLTDHGVRSLDYDKVNVDTNVEFKIDTAAKGISYKYNTNGVVRVKEVSFDKLIDDIRNERWDDITLELIEATPITINVEGKSIGYLRAADTIKNLNDKRVNGNKINTDEELEKLIKFKLNILIDIANGKKPTSKITYRGNGYLFKNNNTADGSRVSRLVANVFANSDVKYTIGKNLAGDADYYISDAFVFDGQTVGNKGKIKAGIVYAMLPANKIKGITQYIPVPLQSMKLVNANYKIDNKGNISTASENNPISDNEKLGTRITKSITSAISINLKLSAKQELTPAEKEFYELIKANGSEAKTLDIATPDGLNNYIKGFTYTYDKINASASEDAKKHKGKHFGLRTLFYYKRKHNDTRTISAVHVSDRTIEVGTMSGTESKTIVISKHKKGDKIKRILNEENLSEADSIGSIASAVNEITDILNNAYIRIDLSLLNNPDKFNLPLAIVDENNNLKGGESISYKKYSDFALNTLSTDILLGRKYNEAGKVTDTRYTNNAFIKFDTDSLNLERKNTIDSIAANLKYTSGLLKDSVTSIQATIRNQAFNLIDKLNNYNSLSKEDKLIVDDIRNIIIGETVQEVIGGEITGGVIKNNNLVLNIKLDDRNFNLNFNINNATQLQLTKGGFRNFLKGVSLRIKDLTDEQINDKVFTLSIDGSTEYSDKGSAKETETKTNSSTVEIVTNYETDSNDDTDEATKQVATEANEVKVTNDGESDLQNLMNGSGIHVSRPKDEDDDDDDDDDILFTEIITGDDAETVKPTDTTSKTTSAEPRTLQTSEEITETINHVASNVPQLMTNYPSLETAKKDIKVAKTAVSKFVDLKNDYELLVVRNPTTEFFNIILNPINDTRSLDLSQDIANNIVSDIMNTHFIKNLDTKLHKNLIKGLSFNIIKKLTKSNKKLDVSNYINKTFKSVIEQHKANDKAALLSKNADASAINSRLRTYDAILDNWDTIVYQVIRSLKTKGLIKTIPNSTIVEDTTNDIDRDKVGESINLEAESNNELTDDELISKDDNPNMFDADSSLRIDPKKTANTIVKRFLMTIRDKDKKGNDLKFSLIDDYLYVDYNVVYDKLLGLLKNKPRSIEQMITVIRSNAKDIPYLDNVADSLVRAIKNKQTNLINAFVQAMTKTESNMGYIGITPLRQNRTHNVVKTVHRNTNQSSDIKIMLTTWDAQFKVSKFVDMSEATDTTVVIKTNELANHLKLYSSNWWDNIITLFNGRNNFNSETGKLNTNFVRRANKRIIYESLKNLYGTYGNNDPIIRKTITTLVGKDKIQLFDIEAQGIENLDTMSNKEVNEFLNNAVSNITISGLRAMLMNNVYHGLLAPMNITLHNNTIKDIVDNENYLKTLLGSDNKLYTEGSNQGFGRILENKTINTTTDYVLSNIYNTLQPLAKLNSKYDKNIKADSYRDQTGKRIYLYTMYRNINNQTLNIFDDPNKTELKEINETLFGKDSVIINNYLTNENDFKEFEINIVDALVQFGADTNKKLVDSPTADIEWYKLLSYMNSGDRNYGHYFYPTMADGNIMITTKMRKYARQFDENNNLLGSDVDTLFKYIVQPELNKIQFFQKNPDSDINLDGYKQASKQFILNAFLNDELKNKQLPRLKNKEIDFNHPDTIDFLKSAFAKHIDMLVEEKLNRWRNDGILTTDSNGIEDFSVIDKDYKNNFTKTETGKVIENHSFNPKTVATEYVTNYMIANMTYAQLFIGDPAAYWNKNVENTVLNISKRLAGDRGSGELPADFTTERKYNVTYVADIPYKSPAYDAIKEFDESIDKNDDAYEYADIDSTDGQELISMYEDLRNRVQDGEVSQALFDLLYDPKVGIITMQLRNKNYYYEEIVSDILKNKILAAKNKKTIRHYKRLYKEWRNYISQPAKPVFVSNETYVSDDNKFKVNARVYIKSSAFALRPRDTANLKIDRLRRAMDISTLMQLNALRDNKSNDDILKLKVFDRVVFKSANKSGAIKRENISKLDFNQTPEDIFTTLTNSVQTVSRKGYRTQQKVPYDPYKKVSVRGTQSAKLLFNNLLDNPTFQQLKVEYDEAYADLFETTFNKLRDEITNDDGTINHSKLQEIFIQEADARNFSIDEYDQLALNNNGTFDNPLFFHTRGENIEGVLMSIITNRVLKIKFPGKSLVLGTPAGFESDTKLLIEDENLRAEYDKHGIVFTDKWTGSLKTKGFILKKDVTIDGKEYKEGAYINPKHFKINGGTLTEEDYYYQPEQIIVPNKLRDNKGKLINLKEYVDENGILNTSQFDNDVLKIFGFRIPTAGHNAMASMEIVGFTDTSLGDRVIATADLVKQMGSDFDIDKLFTYMYKSTIEVKDNYDELIAKLEKSGELQHLKVDDNNEIIYDKNNKPINC